MAQTHAPSVPGRPGTAPRVRARLWLGSGTDGNERLTTATGALLVVHKISFIVWATVTGVHLLAHLPSIRAALRGDFSARDPLGPVLPGRSGRHLAPAGSLVLGVVLALLTIPEFGSWTQAHFGHHH